GLSEHPVRIAVDEAARRIIVLLVATEVVHKSPAAVRLESRGPPETLTHRSAEGRRTRCLAAEPARHEGVSTPVQRDPVRPGRSVARRGRVRRQSVDDAFLDSVPEARNAAARAGTLCGSTNEDARSRTPTAGFGDIESALRPKRQVARVVEVAHDDRSRRTPRGPGPPRPASAT